MAQKDEHNPTQSQQDEMAAKRSMKPPAASDTHSTEAQARNVSSTKQATSPESVAAKNPAALPAIDDLPGARCEVRDGGDPVLRAIKRIVPIDVLATDATDDTVDVDGKGIDARRDESVWHDNVVFSNATPINSVPVPPEGVVDYDSRPGGTLPLVATRKGWHVVYRGVVQIPDPIRTHTDIRQRAEVVFSIEQIHDDE